MNNIELNKKLLNLMESAMSEAAKPDYIDLDKDGDKDETMKKAAKDKEAKDKEVKKESKTDESVSKLSDSLRLKLSAVMEETVEEVSEEIEEELEEDQSADSVTEEEVIEEEDQESLDEMAELLRMAGLGEGTASCSSMPRHSAPTKGPEQVNGYEGNFVGEEEEIEEAYPFGEESEAEMDDHAEKAGDEVAHDMEYDDHHDGAKDDHDEKEGDKVTKEIEFDDKEHEAMKSVLKKLLA